MNMTARLSLTAALLAGFGAFSTSSMAATATGTASATVLTPITVSANTAQLNFGTFAGNTAGTVDIDAGGVRTKSGGVVLATGGTASAASFAVTGSGSATFAVTYTGPFTVTSGSNSMTYTLTTPPATGTLSGGTATIVFGASLAVAAGQAAGTYTGSYAVNVEYN